MDIKNNVFEIEFDSPNVDKNTSMPLILNEIINVLDDLHPNADYNCKLNILLAKTAQMVSFKRICFKEFENIKLINHYAINFMPSGMGKDKICDDLDKHIFKEFLNHFKIEAENYNSVQEAKIISDAMDKYPNEKQQGKKEDYINAKKAELRAIEAEINQATPEGFFQDGKVLEVAGFGSLFVKIAEFGLLLLSKKDTDMLFINSLYEAYDGKISSKSIKYGKREKSVENMPVNILLHSDYNLFKADIKGFFDRLMQMGFARRAVISFQKGNVQSIELNPKQVRARKNGAYSKASVINYELFEIFSNIPENAIYRLTDDAHDNIFHPYCIEISKLSNENQENDFLNKEIRSRALKVLKLAGIFAALNHPAQLVIDEIDFEQAISTVEQLSKDFKAFIDYKPAKKDCYDHIFNFFENNLVNPYTKTELIKKYKDFGFKRDDFRKRFDEIIQIVSEMAVDKNYYLKKEPINNNSGMAISLVKNNIGSSLPQEVKELDELI